MKNNSIHKKISSSIINELLSEISPIENMQTSAKMSLSARLEDLILSKGWGKREFAEKVNKNPSEITKWLSGTQNFTIDTLCDIAYALGISIEELFASKKIQVINKVHVFISSNSFEPAISYFTPFENEKNSKARYSASGHKIVLSSLVSN
jgi:transcriptional regulator with XRE-family HTH domain